MFTSIRWSTLLASVLALGTATAHAADDVFVKEGVVVKPLPKWKQRRLEKKLLRHPGNKVVIEGSPATDLNADVLAGVRTRRAMRPLFGDMFNRRTDFIVPPSVVAAPSVVVTTPKTTVTSPGTIVSIPRSSVAPGDPLVMPGSVEIESPAAIVRPPVISTPRQSSTPVEPIIEPELKTERPEPSQVLPTPADEIPPPVVSTPRKASSSPNPTPVLEPALPGPDLEPTPGSPTPAPSVDPGPTLPITPPVAQPADEPILELPATARPA